MVSEAEALMLTFLLRADEFYIVTRYCYRAFFQFLTLRMSHHTIEYYFKAGLSEYLSADQMKRLGHNLEKLWKKYDEFRPGLGLDLRTIALINQFETTRYPGSSIYVRAAWGISYEELFSQVLPSVPEKLRDRLACFSLPDFDEIVYTLRSSLPQVGSEPIIAATSDAEIYLFDKNDYFSKGEA